MEKQSEYITIEVSEMKRPPSKVKRINEPNIDLMAKAFRNLYYKSIKKEAEKKLNISQKKG